MTLFQLREALESRIPAHWLFVPVVGYAIWHILARRSEK